MQGGMYNLLVTADERAWDRETFVLDVSRYLEHTDERLATRFKSLDDSARQELMTLPTLFAYETPLNRPARVGWIRSVARRGKEIRIKFQFDSELDPIQPERAESMAWDLEIGPQEMNRTHWAVKDVDLLRVLTGGARPTNDVAPYRSKTVTSGTGHVRTADTRPRGGPGSALAEYLPVELQQDFDLVLHLGSGSFAAVYQVVDKESQQRFALKVLNNTPDARERATREVAAAALIHPNILPVLRNHPNGDWFLFPLAEGTLGQLQGWGRLDSQSAIVA